jgi:uncharacterized membrane protein
MISYEDSIVIAAPVSEVFSYATDLRTMPDWIQGLVEVRDVIGTGEGQQCEWTFKMIGVLLRGQAVVVESVENETATHQTIGMLAATWTNTFEPDEIGTKITIGVKYTLPVPVLGRLAEHLTVRRMRRDLGSSLLNLKELLEG